MECATTDACVLWSRDVSVRFLGVLRQIFQLAPNLCSESAKLVFKGQRTLAERQHYYDPRFGLLYQMYRVTCDEGTDLKLQVYHDHYATRAVYTWASQQPVVAWVGGLTALRVPSRRNAARLLAWPRPAWGSSPAAAIPGRSS